MRKSLLKLYAPFLALALVQAGFIAFAPSKGPGTTNQFAGGDFGNGPSGIANQGGGTSGGGTGGAGGSGSSDFSSDAGSGGDSSGGGGGTSAAGSGASAPGAQGGGGEAGPGGGGAVAAGDTSHCKGDRQFNFLLVNPPCRPKWTGGDNGGATYNGVSGDTIKIVLFESEPNEAVNAILAAEGLAQTEAQTEAFDAAAQEFIAKYYELSGRKIEWVRYRGNCPTTPPKPELCKAAASEVVKMKPFLVVWGTPLYAEVFDIWARAGIISLGGWHFDESYFNARRPLRYDALMDGSEAADFIAEFYCKNLAGKKASHSGAIIHPDIGSRGQVRRRLGISVPDIDANMRTAQRVAAKVRSCDSGAKAPIIKGYESDIERAQEQTDATTQAYIDGDVTTVLCMCDPIAPAFGTKGFTGQRYFPENLISGLGFADYDKVGRLYDQKQMEHAFGLSHIANPTPVAEQDSGRMWKASGRSGEPCPSCGVNWAYYNLAASIIHNTGPNLNPATVEQAMLTQKPQGGTPVIPLVKYGPNDYTGVSDIRLVYWSNTAQSNIDGRPGAYIPIDGGRRYPLGSVPGSVMSKVPVAAS